MAFNPTITFCLTAFHSWIVKCGIW
jgi:hypothetical protein